jgi:DNA-binding NtrC family response regulator
MKLLLFLMAVSGFGIVGCKAQKEKYMGQGEKVLVIGRHADMLTKVVQLLKQHGYSAIGEQWNGQAMAAFKKDTIQAVIIGGGVDEESRAYFHQEFPKINPSVKIINAHPQTVLADLQKAFPNKS